MTGRTQDIKQLEWAVGLAQADLQTLRPGDWINLEADLADFVQRSGTPTDLTGPGWSDTGTMQRWVTTAQTGLRQQFERLAQMGVVTIIRDGQKPTPTKLSTMEFMVERGRLTVQAYEGEPYRQLIKSDKIESQVYTALASYLISSGIIAGQIRKCPTCGRIFLLKRKPRPNVEFHCSLKCSRLAATRRYRQKNVGGLKAKERERGHRRYVAKQRRRLGSKVKVRRMPRTLR